jgi:hypothetical protein
VPEAIEWPFRAQRSKRPAPREIEAGTASLQKNVARFKTVYALTKPAWIAKASPAELKAVRAHITGQSH